jgi:hypothetical protein
VLFFLILVILIPFGTHFLYQMNLVEKNNKFQKYSDTDFVFKPERNKIS